MEKCKHNYEFLRRESFHEGACGHVGSCLVDVFYCTKCAKKSGGESDVVITTNGTDI